MGSFYAHGEHAELVDIKTGRIQKADSLIRVGNTVIVKMKNGAFTILRQVKTEKWAIPINWAQDWHRDMVDAMYKMKLLSKEKYEEIVAVQTKRQAESMEKWNMERLVEYAKECGYKIDNKNKTLRKVK